MTNYDVPVNHYFSFSNLYRNIPVCFKDENGKIWLIRKYLDPKITIFSWTGGFNPPPDAPIQLLDLLSA